MTNLKRARPAFQCRITVDEDMGDLFWWLHEKSPLIRPREMLFLMRVGFEVRSKTGALGALPLMPAEQAAGAGEEAAPAQSPASEMLNREASVVSSLNLNALCKPAAPAGTRLN